MPRTHPPYAAEYRRRIVELARGGRSITALAREFEPTVETIRQWIKQAGLDEGLRSDGLTTTEREELNRLRREIRVLREEREILAKAAAWFAQETGANQAAAFASISRSSRNTLISRRSRLSSSRSVVVKPSLRSPSSSPACLIHWRIVSTVGSNSRASAVMLRPPRANSTIRRRYSAAYGGWVRGIWKTPFPYPQHPLRNWVNFSLPGS